jgi:hypothetical protein
MLAAVIVTQVIELVAVKLLAVVETPQVSTTEGKVTKKPTGNDT